MTKWNRLLVVLACCLMLLTLLGIGMWLALAIKQTLLLFSLGGLVAYALNPLVDFLQKRRVGERRPLRSRALSVSAVFLVLLALSGMTFYTLGGRLMEQVTIIQHDAPRYQVQVEKLVGALDRRLAKHNINLQLAEKLKNPPPDLVKSGNNVLQQVLPFVQHLFTDIGESLIVLLIALYFLLYGTEMREKFNALLPAHLVHRTQLWEADVSQILGSFVRGNLIIALIMGIAAAIGCLAVGIRLWLLIGIFVAITSVIPVFGPYIGVVPAIIAAAVGPTRLSNPAFDAAIILIIFFVINEIGANVLYPKLVGSALGLHPVFVLFVLFAGMEVGGIVGILFAPAVAAVVIATAVHLYRFWLDLPDSFLTAAARHKAKQAEDHPAAAA